MREELNEELFKILVQEEIKRKFNTRGFMLETWEYEIINSMTTVIKCKDKYGKTYILPFSYSKVEFDKDWTESYIRVSELLG